MKKYTLDEVYTADMTAFQRERYNRVADEFDDVHMDRALGQTPAAADTAEVVVGVVAAYLSSARC